MKYFIGRRWLAKLPYYIAGTYYLDILYGNDNRYTWGYQTRRYSDHLMFEDLRARGLCVTAYLIWIAYRCFGWLFWEYGAEERQCNREIQRDKYD